MGPTKPDASKEIGSAGPRYRFPEHWKKSANVRAIRPEKAAARIRENAVRWQCTTARTGPRRSTYTPNERAAGNAGALRDKTAPAREKSPADKLIRANFW